MWIYLFQSIISKTYVSIEPCQIFCLQIYLKQLAQWWHCLEDLKVYIAENRKTSIWQSKGKLYNYTLKVLFTKQITFTIFDWSRHKKCWMVVENIMNLSGKPLDADSIHFKIWVCNKLYSCYFTFRKLIDVFSPTDNQCLIKEKRMKKAFMVFPKHY